MLDKLVDSILSSYQADSRTEHIDAIFLPSRQKTIQCLTLLRQLIFPGFFDDRRIVANNIRYHVGQLIIQIRDLLIDQIEQAIRYDINRTRGEGQGDACEHCHEHAAELTRSFLRKLPEIRRLLALDVQATFDGDPAALSTDETIFCYPGIFAIFIHRIGHELYRLKVPVLPRIMSEYAHSETGIDIHPGATIGESFCIDHGTGVVIGETTVIGSHVTIYQGVTLGALSTKGGRKWHGTKRHPTIEDHVTIYGGAIILGGGTVIGKGATIGGTVFLTTSVPAGHTVTMRKGELKMTAEKIRKKKK